MATSTIKGGSFGKEKKGTSPSNPVSKKPLKLPSSTPSGSSSSPSSSLIPKPNEKPVPNYLKPTMSSSLDFSRLAKKSTSDNATQKPILNRRRSFDRPPLASDVRKVIPNVPRVAEIRPLRSSSLSHKPGPSSDRIYARASSSVMESKVKQTIRKGTKKQLKSVTFELSCVNHPTCNHLDIEDDFVGIDSEIQSLPDISEMLDGNQELGDPAGVDIEVKLADNSTRNGNEGTSENVDQVMEQNVRRETVKLDHKLNDKDAKPVMTKPKSEIASETVKFDNKLDEKDEKAVETKQKAGVPAETVSDENPSVISHPTTSAAEIVEIVPKTKLSEQTSSSQSSPSNNLQISDEASAKATIAAGKKEKQEYNNVIEETASKLRGSKSKVMALAGAFETVISLESTNKKR